ncbi:hypothetical protein GLOIN_2v1874254 [Rhizophagus irregularis DAOM 181602=DAOM 197198]|nr:hypothetical protein GLOIN_2v1874254 [Rhizophagus irregularis DAOM 181602=DAOM 197198]
MEEDKTALSFLNTNLLPITSIPDNNIVDKSFQLVNQNKHINANESSVDNIIKSDDEEIHDDALDFDLSKEVNKVDTDIKNGDPNFHYGAQFLFHTSIFKKIMYNIRDSDEGRQTACGIKDLWIC